MFPHLSCGLVFATLKRECSIFTRENRGVAKCCIGLLFKHFWSITVDCSKAEDTFACASQGGKWGERACKNYANIPYEYCPLTCNLCPSK